MNRKCLSLIEMSNALHAIVCLPYSFVNPTEYDEHKGKKNSNRPDTGDFPSN